MVIGPGAGKKTIRRLNVNFFTKLFGSLMNASENIQPQKENKILSNINIEPGKPIILELEAGTYYRCTCGNSSNMPFCSGACKDSGCTPVEFEVKEKQFIITAPIVFFSLISWSFGEFRGYLLKSDDLSNALAWWFTCASKANAQYMCIITTDWMKNWDIWLHHSVRYRMSKWFV